MTIKQRLIKLESALPAIAEDIHIMIFFVDCGGIKPIGYRCNEGIEIFKVTDESEDEFKTRCDEAVNWPIGKNSIHTYELIYYG